MAKIIIEIERVQGPMFDASGISMPIEAKISVKGNKDRHDLIPTAIAHKLAACYSESLSLGISSAFKSIIIEAAKGE
ncbi:hypothetical protein ACNKTV_002779 [Vibrio parahaemolyticus]|nr:hypothetical protein [Vibrio parahaemolyticus]ELB2092026.1 hypothetical protein [Vibrio parahaemolyticus]